MSRPGSAVASLLRAMVLVVAGVSWASGATAFGAAPAPPWSMAAADAARANPVGRDAKSVAAGKAVYHANCVACHGERGRGDGPAAVALVPRPADLGLPAVQAQSDGSLFTKISDGRPPMPGWAAALTDTDRWNVVNFLRSLPPRQPLVPDRAGARPRAAVVPPARPDVVATGHAATAAPPDTPPPPSTSDWVPRSEYETLKRDFEALRAKVDALAAATPTPASAAPAPAAPTPAAPTPAAPTPAAPVADVSAKLEEVRRLADAGKPGKSAFMVTGYGFVNYADVKGENNNFSAVVNPVFLWRPWDRLLVSSELEVALEGGETAIDMEYFDLTYEVSDSLSLRAGKFLTPFSKFKEDLHPAWINRLPDQPPYADGDRVVVPESVLGVEARGGVPIRNAHFNWSAYLANGPRLLTEEPNVGGFNFKNYEDDNGNKAFGGRLELLPIPSVELGYSFQLPQVGPGSDTVDATLQSVDLSFVEDVSAISGRLTARVEHAWTHVGAFPYTDPATGALLPAFDNTRRGGYAQVSYRPTKVAALKNWEFVGRYDWLDLPDDPDGTLGFFDENRRTAGVDYWLTPAAALKAAYVWDSKSGVGVDDQNAFLLQFTYGF